MHLKNEIEPFYYSPKRDPRARGPKKKIAFQATALAFPGGIMPLTSTLARGAPIVMGLISFVFLWRHQRAYATQFSDGVCPLTKDEMGFEAKGILI